MLILMTVLVLGLSAASIYFLIEAKKFQKAAQKAQDELSQERQLLAGEKQRIRETSEIALRAAQQTVDEQMVFLQQESQRIKDHYEAETRKMFDAAQDEIQQLKEELQPLRQFQSLAERESQDRTDLSEALSHVTALRDEAETLLRLAAEASREERLETSKKLKALQQEVESVLLVARQEADRIVKDAEKRAEETAGEAFYALREKNLLEQALKSIRNIIEGYGDRYIIPTHSILDDLAVDFQHLQAGKMLKAARETSRAMIEAENAAACEYVEPTRRLTAIKFVIDAFNGRVDGILSRIGRDNIGQLQQEIHDAFNFVNLHGAPFRNARILSSYLDSRLDELKWGVICHELKLKEREEQRRIQEQIREEEKARREYERAIRDAASEKEMLRKAMETAQLQIETATQEQKAKYEAELSALTQKLKQAEERNQRAISMAQQTRRGHVYIISNLGSFGENIYKIGLTRRLEPFERIYELGDSSVPFDFDVHALIFSEDAPALESKLHKHFVMSQVNKVKHHKEFFRVNIANIRSEIEKLGIEAKWTMVAEAADYKETLAIEEALKKNPHLREAWVNRQLELEDIDEQSERIGIESSSRLPVSQTHNENAVVMAP